MPWSYSVGSGSAPSYSWTALNTLNQGGSAISVPACCITHVAVLAGGYGGAVLTRLAAWNPGGAVITQSGTFWMSAGTASVGGQSWQTVTVDPVNVGAGTYWFGLYRNPSGGHVFGTASSGNGTTYRKTNTNGYPSIQGMDGYQTESKASYVGVFYITVPIDITSASVTRNSDTSQTINWTNHSSSDQPYDNIWVDRWDNVTNGWYNIATIGGGDSSYTDTTTSENRQYRYRVLAYNRAGNTGSHTYTGYIDTTPAVPPTVVATRVSTTVQLTWLNPASNETGIKIQSRQYTGGAWGAWGDETTTAADSVTWTDTTPYAIGQYRVRSYNATLNSAYVESNEIVTIQEPSAPTNLAPNLIAIDGDDSNLYTWLHNPVDGTGQTKYSIQYRALGGSYPGTPQVNAAVSTTSSHTFAGATFTNGTTYEYQVKTWGQHANASVWSTTGTFYAVAKPVGTITNPGATYGLSALTVIWSYSQAQSHSQSIYLSRLYASAGVLLETKQLPSTVVAGGTGSSLFSTALENNTSYTVTLTVQETSGLWSTLSTVNFTTDFYTPPIPTFTATFDSTACSTSIVITNPSPSGTEVETIYNNVYRNNTLVAGDVPPNTVITDYVPNIHGDNTYYVEAVSATPTIAVSATTIVTTALTGYFVFNSGNAFEKVSIVYGDVSLSEKRNIDTVLKRYEGRGYPVKYQSTKKEQIISFSVDLLKSGYENLIDVIESLGDLFYRDWEGRYFYCSLDGCSFSVKDNEAYQFSCTITRVEGGY